MSHISNMTTKAVGGGNSPFVNDNPGQGRTQIAGYSTERTKPTTLGARGPLSELYNTNKKRATWSYPENIGTGPFQNWILFDILESVQTAGAESGGNQFGTLGGVTNKVFSGGPGQQGISYLTKTISSVLKGGAVEKGLNYLGISNMELFSAAQKVRATTKSIALYVPNTIVFNQANEFSTPSLTDQLGIILGGAEALQGTQNGSRMSASALYGLEAAARGAAKSFGGGDDMRDMILYNTGGVAINPQLEVLFKQTGLRTFQFDFLMAARTRTEMAAIHDIVNQFRHAAAPSFAQGGAGRYLVPPSEFDISFKFAGADNIMIPKISTCVIDSVSCDYAPSGAFATVESGRPVSIRLQLAFKEVDLITKERIVQGF